jgi:hypothetical protein
LDLFILKTIRLLKLSPAWPYLTSFFIAIC